MWWAMDRFVRYGAYVQPPLCGERFAHPRPPMSLRSKPLGFWQDGVFLPFMALLAPALKPCTWGKVCSFMPGGRT
jgi:hypothetical protein